MKVGPMQNFVYLLADEPSGEAMVVDSGWETDPIVAAARDEQLEVKFVVATHHHPDHTSTIQDLARTLGAKVVAHKSSPIAHDASVSGGDILQIGNRKVKILYTPGHTEDSICLYDGENLFTGDTLFIGNCGRTDLPGGSPTKMFESLHSIILKLPPGTTVYPGHDYGEVPFRSLSDEAKLNPVLLAKTYSQFLRIP
jgi:glyoxylase-like metal-dependent hydrolase (beta-lactamase superfamily II)